MRINILKIGARKNFNWIIRELRASIWLSKELQLIKNGC